MKVYIVGSEPPFRGEIVLEGEPPETLEPLLQGTTERNAIIGDIAVELDAGQVERFEAMPLVRVKYL